MRAFQHVYDILAELAPSCDSYLGVGVQEGMCVKSVVLANPRINLTLCDTWGPDWGGTDRGSHDHVATLLREAGHAGSVLYLDGDSHVLVPQLVGTYDLSYVDGDHSPEGAFTDLMNVWPRTRRAMVVHDMTTDTVPPAFARFITTVREGRATLHVAEGPGQGTVVLYREDL